MIMINLEMFSDYPLGCGHRCTAVLSPLYMDEQFLTGPADNRARSSHSTYMTILVEQGIPGVIIYTILMLWAIRLIFRLRPRMRTSTNLLSTTYAATVAALAAIAVGDLFVDYLKFEARFWFIALLSVIDKLDKAAFVQDKNTLTELKQQT